MFHYVQQLVANNVCVLFGAEHIRAFFFFKLKTAACFSQKQHYESDES